MEVRLAEQGDGLSGFRAVGNAALDAENPIARQPLLDLVAHPAPADTICATTEEGQLVISSERGHLEIVRGAPPTAIEWESGGPFVGVNVSARGRRWENSMDPSKPSMPSEDDGTLRHEAASTNPPTAELPGIGC